MSYYPYFIRHGDQELICRSEQEGDALINVLLANRVEGDMIYLYSRASSGAEKVIKQVTVIDGKLDVWQRR
jgi:hypothetical protein